MKKLILLFSLFLLISCGTFNRYNLTDETDDKDFLKEEIHRLKKEEKITTTTPLIVIDGKPYRFNVELKEKALPISKNKISKIEVLKKKIGVSIYGEPGEKGVLIITTKDYKIKESDVEESKSLPENIYISYDGKQVGNEFIKTIDKNDIYTVTVLKDSLILKQFYPNHNYVGSIQIETYVYKTNEYRQKLSLISNDYKNLIQNISHKEEYSRIEYTLNDTLLIPDKNRIKKLLDLDFSSNVQVNVTINEFLKAEVKLTTE